MNQNTFTYQRDVSLDLDQFIDLYHESTLGERRPVHDPVVMRQMMENANLTITAWNSNKLVGIARTLTDFGFVAYLADLAVSQNYQRQGIGKQLVQETQAALGESCQLVLLSAPLANEYYPRLGFSAHPRAWVLNGGKRVR